MPAAAPWPRRCWSPWCCGSTPPSGGPPPDEVARAGAVEDMDLLADSDALDLMEGWDGSFYEWAAAQSDTGESEG